MKISFDRTFTEIIGLENLLAAWEEFIKGKRKRADVQEFYICLMDNIVQLHKELASKTYRHGGYHAFNISDPKPRNIHKASVRDRLVHHAIYRVLYPFFNRTFVADSFSCRIGKGTHKALNRFRAFAYKVSHNNTRTCWVLKCDIKRFFTSIDHRILLAILKDYIPDHDIIWLLREIIGSFSSTKLNVGLPLGNLTSQLFVNIYMNRFDQFVKHALKARYYIRYADDFVTFSTNRAWLEKQIPQIRDFLQTELKLMLRPDKMFIKTLASGIDFLGWIHFPDHRVLRTRTKQRMLKRISERLQMSTIQSYLGLLKHGNTYELVREIKKGIIELMWKIILFETTRGDKPVEEFIKSCNPQTAAKLIHHIDLLEKYGPRLGMPYAKKLTNHLYELRVRGKQEIRIIYCFIKSTIYLVHAFQKQTQKTPKKELETALKRYQVLT